MLCLLLEFAMFIAGIIAVAKGKFTLTRRKIVKGAPARIVGVILLLPLPVNFGIGLIYGIMIAAQGERPNTAEVQKKFAPVEAGTTFVGLLAAFVVALSAAKPPRKYRPREEEEEYEVREDLDERDNQYDEHADDPRPPKY